MPRGCVGQAGESDPLNDQQVNDFLASDSFERDPLVSAIDLLYHADEASAVQALLPDAQLELTLHGGVQIETGRCVDTH